MDTHEEGKDKRLALYDPIEAGLANLEEQYGAGPAQDLSLPENYEACRKALAEMRGIRGKTEKLRKELKADALAYGRMVDGAAKRIIDKVQAIEAPFADAKKEYDTKIEIEKREKALAEERRVDAIYARISSIGALAATHISSTAAEIDGIYASLGLDLETCDDWAMEFADKARVAIEDAQAKLEELHDMKVQQEQLEAEKARAAKETAEREEATRIQREKEAEEERARIAKEREALEAERAAIQAEAKRLAAEQAEHERIRAAEQAERDQAAKRAQEERDRAAKAELDRLAAEQAEKDRIAEEERKKLEDEIEALKQAQEPPPAPEPEQPLSTDPPVPQPAISQEAKNAAGRAIMAITGNKTIAKAILEAIINGEIPNIQFTTGATE